MAQSLVVNNKEYIPSVVLAKEFNYTSDYISKLARDEKVLGTRVGRQWFIEPESLRTYMQQLEVEKRISKEELSQQRKLERTDQANASSDALVESPLVVSGKSIAVVMCGLLVGTLGLALYANGIHTAQLAHGSKMITEQLAEKVATGVRALVPQEQLSNRSVANSLSSSQRELIIEKTAGPRLVTAGTYTVFPEIATTSSSSSISVNESDVIENLMLDKLPFSDEVVLEEQGDSLQVRPIFKDTTGKLYELSTTVLEESEHSEATVDSQVD